MEEGHSDSRKRKEMETSSVNITPEDQQDIDEKRGFNEEELNTCLKVLNSFKYGERINTLQEKRYKSLRSAGQIFVEGISNRYFKGYSVQEYNHKKQRKIDRKLRKKLNAEEDKRILAKSQMRANQLKNLEKLTEEIPEIFEKVANEHNGKTNALLLMDKNNKNSNNVLPVTSDDEDEEMPIDPMLGENCNNNNDNNNKKSAGIVESDSEDEGPVLNNSVDCYQCKKSFKEVHSFYDKMCLSCGNLNFEKRTQTCDLRGRVAMVTGARVKIGYQTALILLRNGAQVIATSRFPRDTALRYSKEHDFDQWKDRLHIYGLDMRFLKDVELFCDLIKKKYTHLDILINNAAQTIRRPVGFYQHLMTTELAPTTSLPESVQKLIESHHPSQEMKHIENSKSEVDSMDTDSVVDSSLSLFAPLQQPTSSAELAVLPIIPEDSVNNPKLFPPGKYDENAQQIDLRKRNTWIYEADEVSTGELAEVHAINTLAPYILNTHLLPLLKKSTFTDKFIINVSSVEGQFYHKKSSKHPHTNMAKAALNMMTRTSGAYYRKSHIYMNAVDTGWVSDMNPLKRSVSIATKYGELFRNPLDDIDGAARVVDPVFSHIKGKFQVYAKFFKNYSVAPW